MNDNALNIETDMYLERRYGKAAEDAQARKDVAIESRASDIVSDKDYCADLILNMIENERNDVIWALLNAQPDQVYIKLEAFRKAYIKEATIVAQSEMEV